MIFGQDDCRFLPCCEVLVGWKSRDACDRALANNLERDLRVCSLRAQRFLKPYPSVVRDQSRADGE